MGWYDGARLPARSYLSQWDENTLPLARAIFALIVAVMVAEAVVIFVGVWQGFLTFVGIALLAGALEAMGWMSNDLA